MDWKNWPYSIRGGVGLLAVGIACTIVFYFGDWRAGQLIDWLMVLTIMPFAFAGFFVGGIKDIVIGLVMQYLLYFALGGTCGWIYGKVKK